MASTPKIIPVSDLRQAATDLVTGVVDSEPATTEHDRGKGVIVGLESSQQTQHELAILRLLAQGENEIPAGVWFDVETVFTVADETVDPATP